MENPSGMFSVNLQTLVYPPLKSQTSCFEALPDRDREIITKIYDSVNGKLMVSQGWVIAATRNTVCCCCLEAGLAMFTLLPTEKGQVGLTLKGFLIEQSDLRTAWHLYRMKLPVLAGAGWSLSGSSLIGPDMIDSLYEQSAAELPDELRTMIEQILPRIAENPAPFSFLVTGLPPRLFPVQFNAAQINPPSADSMSSGDQILLRDDDRMKRYLSVLAERSPISRSVILYCRPRRGFLSMVKAWLEEREKQEKIEKGLAKVIAKDYEAQLERYTDDYVFALYVGGERILLLDPRLNHDLNEGYIDFDMLLTGIQHELKRPPKEYSLPEPKKAARKSRKDDTVELPVMPSVEDAMKKKPKKPAEEEPKKKGLFGLFRK